MIKQQRTSPGRILIVDDEPAVRTSLAKILTNAKNEVILRPDGDDVVDICSKHEIDVILLDINLPGIDGVEVCRQVREKFADIQIIMITGLADGLTCQKTITLGANDFIPKPIDAGEVLIRVKNAVLIRNLQRSLKNQTTDFQHLLSVVSELSRKVNQLPQEDTEFDQNTNKLSEILGDYTPDDGFDSGVAPAFSTNHDES